MGSGVGSDNDLSSSGTAATSRFSRGLYYTHADASSLESRDAETIGLVLAELIQEVHTAGVDDAVAHEDFVSGQVARRTRCSCRLGRHRVAVNYTDTAADELDPVDTNPE